MSSRLKPLYCSQPCFDEEMDRSFGPCPECLNMWDSNNSDDDRFYRNNTWVMCKTCSIRHVKCVICGSKVDHPDVEFEKSLNNQSNPTKYSLLARICGFFRR